MGTWVTVNEKSVLNMVSSNFLGIAGNKEIMVSAPSLQSLQGLGLRRAFRVASLRLLVFEIPGLAV